MKNYLFYAILVLHLLGCGAQRRIHNSKIYEDIYICQGDQDVIGKSLNLYRNQLDYLDKFEYSQKNDTIYILEMYSIQGDAFLTIWNKDTIISYTNTRNSFESIHEPLFSKYMIRLVSEWNISEIRKEEINSKILPSELIYATKVVFNDGKYQIDCFSFKDFFNLERDSNDYL